MMLARGFHKVPRFTNQDLEKERAKLTDEEKKSVHDDLYGITQQTKNVTSDHVRLLRDEIEKFDDDDKKHYLRAVRQGVDLFTLDDRDLMLFLNKDRLDVKDAAARVISYWDQRVALFGETAAFRPLVTDMLPLKQEDEGIVPLSYMRMLPQHDEHGRRVLFVDVKSRSAISFSSQPPTMMRFWWCVLHEALRDRERSIHGDLVILVSGRRASFRKYNCKEIYLFFSTLASLPLRTVALHYCFPPNFVETIQAFVLFIAGRSIRTRFLLQSGSEDDVTESLKQYGLTKKMLPTCVGGDYVLPRLDKKRRREDV